MQLGNFIPHPIAQTIGKIGNIAGMGIDAFQTGMDIGEGNYGSAAINAGSMIFPMALESQTFRRNSKYLKPGEPLYQFSPQASGSSKRVQYIEPFIATRHMTNNNLLANRGLLGALATETAIDTKEHGGMIKRADGGYSTTGYKADSPDRYNPYNLIPSGRITMKNVPHPVMGVDNYGNQQYMLPGGEYQFPGQQVFETPIMKEGGIPQRYKTMGFTHVGQKKAGDGQHKWKVLAKKGDSYKVVQGGYKGMQDFSQHHSEQRKKNFWSRMGGKDSAKATDPFSPLYWHKRLGTWETGGPVEMQGGGKTNPPIYVTDPHDPRLQAYQDSLEAYTTTNDIYKKAQSTGILNVSTGKNKTDGKAKTGDTIVPSKTKTFPYSKFKGDPGFDYNWYNRGTEQEMYPETINAFHNTRWYDPTIDWSVNYKQPVQPVLYQEPPQKSQIENGIPTYGFHRGTYSDAPIRKKQQLQSIPKDDNKPYDDDYGITTIDPFTGNTNYQHYNSRQEQKNAMKGIYPKQKYGGWLDSYQSGGWADPNRLATVNNPVRGISAGTPTLQGQHKNASPAELTPEEQSYQEIMNESMRSADPRRSAMDKAGAIARNPMTAAQYVVQGQPIPDYFEKGDRNLYDYAVDVLNPMTYVDAAKRTATLEHLRNMKSLQDLPGAALNTAIDAGALIGLGSELRARPNTFSVESPTAYQAGELKRPVTYGVEKTAGNWLKNYGAKSEKNLISSEIPAITKTTPTSEIDWAKWNSEIPNNPELLNEYNTIEQSSKKTGTWMKNPDGTKFEGTPEQFVQQNSSNFKKAFSNGHNEVWRGVTSHYPELKPYEAIFTGNKDLASHYTGNKNKLLTETDPVTSSGMYNLAHPKSTNSLTMDALGKEWGNVSLKDPSQVKELLEKRIPFYEQQIKKQKDFLESGTQNRDGSWSFPNTDIKYSNDLYKEGTKGYDELLHSSKESLKNIDNLVDNPRILQEMRSNLENKRNLEIDEYARIHKLTDENRKKLGTNIITDDIAKYIEDADLDFVRLNNIHDGAFGNVSIVNHKKGNYLKSLVGNNGMFDMTNPNIYKSLLPAGVTLGALKSAMSQQDTKQYGGKTGWLNKY